jgi:HSP20 family molecular chaperone IbpA
MYFDLQQIFPFVNYSFSRPFYESDGFEAVEKDGKLYIVINALGISKENIQVSVETDPENANKQNLLVKGNTHNEVLDKEFSLTWKRYTLRPISQIDWELKNGLLTMEIAFKSPVKPDVLINQR